MFPLFPSMRSVFVVDSSGDVALVRVPFCFVASQGLPFNLIAIGLTRLIGDLTRGYLRIRTGCAVRHNLPPLSFSVTKWVQCKIDAKRLSPANSRASGF